MSSTKPQIITPTKLTLSDAREKITAYIDALIKGQCSFNLRHDPIEKFFNLVSVNSADSMKVLIPQSAVRLDSNSRRFTELVINYV